MLSEAPIKPPNGVVYLLSRPMTLALRASLYPEDTSLSCRLPLLTLSQYFRGSKP